jgi:hypothetical protein
MAHAQIEPAQQLVWHLRSLSAAEAVGGERVRAFYPSLYANLAEVNLRLGNQSEARRWIARARETAPILPADGYARMIRSLIERVERAVELAEN